MPPARSSTTLAAAPRLASIDTYRGFVMFLMMAEVLRLSAVAAKLPDNAFWSFLAFHQSHVPWAGCSLHDLIQPSFSFLVGVSLPFSIASRVTNGHSRARMIGHAVWRAVVLVLLGVFLRSVGRQQTNWTFEDTLSQIGFGYVPLFLLGFTRPRWQWTAFITILVGYWCAFAWYPLPPSNFNYAAVGVPADWPHHYTGLASPSVGNALRGVPVADTTDPATPFAAHWNKNSNLAWAFDTWFLNLFPRPKTFLFNTGGYATLSFIPTLATMILGLIAGRWLLVGQASGLPYKPEASARDTSADPSIRNPNSEIRTIYPTVPRLLLTALTLLLVGLAAHHTGLCPNVKRIWTPTWVLFSGGWCFFFLAAFYAVIDVAQLTSWSFPLRVIGANSIAAYLLAHGPDRMILNSLRTHFGPDIFKFLGSPYEPLLAGAAVLAIEWLILYWLYRQKIHIRI